MPVNFPNWKKKSSLTLLKYLPLATWWVIFTCEVLCKWCTIRGNISDVLKTVINQNNFSVNCTSTFVIHIFLFFSHHIFDGCTDLAAEKKIHSDPVHFFTVTKKPEIQDVCEYSICRCHSFRFWSFCSHDLWIFYLFPFITKKITFQGLF